MLGGVPASRLVPVPSPVIPAVAPGGLEGAVQSRAPAGRGGKPRAWVSLSAATGHLCPLTFPLGPACSAEPSAPPWPGPDSAGRPQWTLGKTVESQARGTGRGGGVHLGGLTRRREHWLPTARGGSTVRGDTLPGPGHTVTSPGCSVRRAGGGQLAGPLEGLEITDGLLRPEVFGKGPVWRAAGGGHALPRRRWPGERSCEGLALDTGRGVQCSPRQPAPWEPAWAPRAGA